MNRKTALWSSVARLGIRAVRGVSSASGKMTAKALTSAGSVGRQALRGGTQLKGPLARAGAGAPRALASRLGKSSVGKVMTHKGFGAVRSRMVNRSLLGAGVGSAASVIRDKSQGRDVSIGRAVGAGLLGGTVGAAAGTTVGKRSLRRVMSPKSTPTLSGTKSIGSLFTPRGMAQNVKNMAPIEKGYLAVNAVGTTRAMMDPKNEGQRGRILGGAVGEAGAMLGISRWRGVRRLMGRTSSSPIGARPGSMGSIARGLGAYAGATTVGTQVGKRFDKKKVTREAPYG